MAVGIYAVSSVGAKVAANKINSALMDGRSRLLQRQQLEAMASQAQVPSISSEQLAENVNAAWGPGKIRLGKMFPRIDPSIGGFVNSDVFYDYMLNHARNTPVEVVGFELQKGTGQVKYFIASWERNSFIRYNNTPRKAFFTMNVEKYGINYSKNNVRAIYHTHKFSLKASDADINVSNTYKIPIYMIRGDGKSSFYFTGSTYPVNLNYQF